MISAEDARKITCDTRKTVNDFISAINNEIKIAAEDGKWSCYINYNEGTSLKKYLSNITEILMDNGYEVTIFENGDELNTYEHKLKISW